MSGNAWIVLLFLAGVAAFVGMILRVAALGSRRAYENLRRLAEQLGLQAEVLAPRLGFYALPAAAGAARGKRVRLHNFTTGAGKSRRTWSAVGVAPAADGGLTFQLGREGLATRLRRLLGAKEIKVGNAAFDDAWFIETNAPDFFAAALLPELQQKLDGLPGRWRLEDGVVTYAEEGLFSDDRRCARMPQALDAACDLADVAEVYARHAPPS